MHVVTPSRPWPGVILPPGLDAVAVEGVGA